MEATNSNTVYALFDLSRKANDNVLVPQFICETYEKAEKLANILALRNDTAYTIVEYPIYEHNEEITEKIFTVRMMINKDYDNDFTVLSIKQSEKEKEPSVIVADDDDSVLMGKFTVVGKEDNYNKIIEMAKKKFLEYISTNTTIEKQK